METLHVKFERQEAIDFKKDLLSSEVNLINSIKQIEDYRTLRILELKKKTQLRTQLKKFSLDVKELISSLPKIKEVKSKQPQPKVKIDKTKKITLERELKEIKTKLKQLD